MPCSSFSPCHPSSEKLLNSSRTRRAFWIFKNSGIGGKLLYLNFKTRSPEKGGQAGHRCIFLSNPNNVQICCRAWHEDSKSQRSHVENQSMKRDIDRAKFVGYEVSSPCILEKMENKYYIEGYRRRRIFLSLWPCRKKLRIIDFFYIVWRNIDFSPWRRSHYILLTPDSESTCIFTYMRVLKIKISDPFFGYEHWKITICLIIGFELWTMDTLSLWMVG